MPAYVPDPTYLTRFAQVMVDFALNKGKGLKPGEGVLVEFDDNSTPLALEIYKRVLQKGGHPIPRHHISDFTRVFYKHANKQQLKFNTLPIWKGTMKVIKHRIFVLAPKDPLFLKDVDPEKIKIRREAYNNVRKYLLKLELEGKYFWTLTLYGTSGLAKEAGLSLQEYWDQIIKAIYLDYDDPVKKWQQAFREIDRVRKKLTDMKIQWLRVVAKGTDIRFKIGADRKWLGGEGHNIPSFEVFTTPDYRFTEGYITFDLPLYRAGNKITGIYLEFKKGRVVRFKARRGKKHLEQMLKTKGGDYAGEVSLTDKRLSRITKFMADTLFDENYGGKYGNFHMALGFGYRDAYNGDSKGFKESDWKKRGFNYSVVHSDIIMTTNRKVTATLANGKEVLIYKDGKFVI